MYGKQLAQWAGDMIGDEDDLEESSDVPNDVTLDDVLARTDLQPDARAWLEEYGARGPEWAVAHNPPSWVKDEALWEKAKRAAEHATGDATNYAFVTWWYLEHGG